MKTASIVAVPALLAVALGLSHIDVGARDQRSGPAPEFTADSPDDWINSAPLTLDDLAGNVVLLDIWTFDCWNCYRSIPWMHEVEKRFADDNFTIVGIHTPEFEHEKKRANVVEKVKEFGIRHPVMLDNDSAYWRALDNKYWPAFYVLDKNANIRGYFIGETHSGDKRARQVEALIGALLREP